MNRVLVNDLVGRFQHAADLGPPIDWYRAMVSTHLLRKQRAPLYALYDQPITVPITKTLEAPTRLPGRSNRALASAPA